MIPPIYLWIIFLLLPSSHSNNLLRAQFDYSNYNSLLQETVDENGIVDYRQLKIKEKILLGVAKEFETVIEMDSWTKNDQLAYWINLYNLQTIVVLTQHNKVKSILEIDKGKTWDIKRIKVMENLFSLNEIENEIIRKKFNDPRIHFAINCGAESCPPLMKNSYDGKLLNEQLNLRTIAFIRDRKNIVSENQSVKISKIFEWYKKDFGNIIDFINLYSDTKILMTAKIEYFDYSWKLNGKR